MKKIIVFYFCLMLGAISHASAALPPVEKNNGVASSLHGMLQKTMPSVVNVYVQGQMPPSRNPSMDPSQNNLILGPRFQDVGSGVIIDAKNGYIVTNAHVVRYSQIIVVTLNDGRKYRGKLIGLDGPSDIAVIKINATALNAIPFADSDKAKVGDFVVAIGSPFGVLTQTVTSGIISALNRSELGIEGYENFIQTDASINPGNSGGALVDTSGQLVGINTAILAPSGGNIGIGFAIPSNMVKNVAEQLIQYGKVERGLLGVYVQDLTPDLADALNANGVKGALVTQVSPGSPAEKAGLEPKDIVEDINGKPIENGAQLRNVVGLTRVGNKLDLKVLRKGKFITLTATIEPRQKVLDAPMSESFLSGVRLRDYDEIDFDSKEIKGVQVLDLDQNSPAALKGLRPGDVIVNANNQPVTSVAQLVKIASSDKARLLLEVQKYGGGITFMVIDNN